MKSIIKIAILSIISFLFANTGYSQTKATTSFKVYGNCEMCKKNIEAALDQKGVKKAVWNQETKMLEVKYDSAKVSIEQLHKYIQKAGYSTDRVKADEKAYKELSPCCQYKEGTKPEEHKK